MNHVRPPKRSRARSVRRWRWRWRWLVGLLTLCATVAGSADTSAEGVLSQPWQAIRTEHFVVHFHETVAELGADVAAMCEAAHERLAEDFGGGPEKRTHVVLTDHTDQANGLAYVVPWQTMRLNVAPPDADSTLGFYDNWMWNLVIHEYTHILHLSQARGVPRTLNTTLGTQLAPNQASPRWLIEGVATWAESSETGTGRLNSSLFDMYLRAAVLEGRFPKLGAVSGDPFDWPYATVWYLYGGHFVDWLVGRFGLEAFQSFISAYAGHLLPFRLNSTARKTLGSGFVDEWPGFRAATHGRFIAEALAARVSGLTPTTAVTSGGHRTRRLAVGPSGEVAWVRNDGRSTPTLVVRGGGSEREVEIRGAGHFVFVGPDRIAISLSHVVDRFLRYRDIFFMDLDTAEATPLTWGARARDLSLSPDARTLAFSAIERGRTDLWTVDISSGERVRVFRAASWAQATTPTWAPDGRSLVFAYAVPGQGRDLYRLELGGGTVSRMTADRAVATDPWFAPGGELLLFSSDRSGRFEVYVLRISDGAVRRLVAVDTGAFSPVAVPVEAGWRVYFSTYSADGFDIASATFDNPDLFAAGEHVGEATHLVTQATWAASPELAEAERRPLLARMRVPRWTPLLGLSMAEQIAGVEMESSDAPGANSIGIVAEWAFSEQTPIIAGAWSNRRLPIGIDLFGSRTLERRSRSLVAGGSHLPFVEEQIRAGGGFDVPFPRIWGRHTVGARYELVLGRFLDPPALDVRPEYPPPRLPDFRRQDALRLWWVWADVEEYARSISPEWGTVLRISSRFRSPAIGSDVESGDVGVSATHYAALGRGHVLALRAAGGFGTANRRRRRLFGVGGLFPQDIFLAARDLTPAGNSHVRGYEPNVRSGDRYYLANVEYRFPVAVLDAGSGTVPLFFRELHGALFFDTGNASDRRMPLGDALYGVGAELRLSMSFGYVNPASLRLGVARGAGPDGIFDLYMVYGWEF